jgi:hypothetical protein
MADRQRQTEAENQLVDLISIRFKHLRVVLVRVRRLRQRCGEPEENSRHRFWPRAPHAAASGFLRGGARWQAMARAIARVMKLRKIFRREAAAP